MDGETTYGDVGVLPVFVGDDCADACCTGCDVTIFLVGAYSLNDLCLLLIDFPARYEKLSRCDLLRVLLVNMLTDL